MFIWFWEEIIWGSGGMLGIFVIRVNLLERVFFEFSNVLGFLLGIEVQKCIDKYVFCFREVQDLVGGMSVLNIQLYFFF